MRVCEHAGVTLVIAHRGASAQAPENTVAAFELAVRLGAEGIELDVRRTADDELVIHHDAHLPDGRSVRATIAAVLDSTEMVLVDLRVRCRDGRGKTFRLHRRFDRPERVMYLVAEEIPPGRGRAVAGGPERRAHERVG